MPTFLAPFTPSSGTISSADIGTQADAVAASPNSNASLIALTKLSVSKQPVLGSNVSANAMPVVLAADSPGMPITTSPGSAIYTVNNGLNAGENPAVDTQFVTQYWDYADVTAAGTLVIGSVINNGVIVFGGVECIAPPGAFNFDVYDNTAGSGTKMAPTTQYTAAADNTKTVGTKCKTGLTVVLATGAAACQVRVKYRMGN